MMTPYNARALFWVAVTLITAIFIIRSCNACSKAAGDTETHPEVSLPQGKLRGFNIVTNHKRIINGFVGIPFAQPPIGNLRFRAPLAATAWTETLSATTVANVCPQISGGNVIGEEDCLYLNVYTPQHDSVHWSLRSFSENPEGQCSIFYPSHGAHRKQFALGKSPRFLYSFEYLRTFKYDKSTVIPLGIQHADDEPFIFPIDPRLCESASYNCEMSGSDLKMVDIMVDLFTSFAINGTPTLTLENGVTWEPYSTEDNYLRIGNGPNLGIEVEYSFFKERMDFWNDLITLHSERSDVPHSRSEVSYTPDIERTDL